MMRHFLPDCLNLFNDSNMKKFHQYSLCQSIYIELVKSSEMARIKALPGPQKVFIHALLEAGKIQNGIAVQLGCSQCASSKITKRT